MFHVEARSDRVAILRMDDGKVNAIGPEFVERFPAAWQEAAAGRRAIVLAGNAKAFGAGLNLKVLPGLSKDELVAFFRRFVSIVADTYAHPAPVVAAVDGPALAGGAILALCAEIRFASPAARIGLTEMPVGIPFPAPILALARDALPPSEIGPAIFEGVIREGEAAVKHGWAHELTSREDILDQAVARAETLAAFNPRAYALSKTALRGPVAQAAARFEKDGAQSYVDDLMHEETLNAIVAYFERVTRKA